MDRRRVLLVAIVGVLAFGGVAALIGPSILRDPPRRTEEGPRPGDPAAVPTPGEDPRLRGADAAPAISSSDLLPLAEAPPGGIGVLVAVRTWEAGTRRASSGLAVRLRLDAPEPVDFPTLEARTDERGQVRFGPFPVPRVPRRLATRATLVAELVARPFGPFAGWLVRTEGRVDARGSAGTDEVRWLDVSLTSEIGAVVAGRVVTADGTPIPNVRVHLGERWRGRWSDDDGAFSLVVPTPGRHELHATLEIGEERDAVAVLPLDVPAEGLDGVRVVLEGVGRIAGRLLEADGRPAAGVEVVLTPPGSTAADLELRLILASGDFGLQRLARRVGPDGTFSIVGTTDGRRYDVRTLVAPDTEQVLAEAVASGSTALNLRVQRQGVRPRAVDARNGLPVYGELHVRSEAAAVEMVMDPLRPRSASGEFLATSGTVVLILARARGYADAVVRHTVSAESGLDDVVLRLHPADAARIVRIRCVDERGVPRPWPPTRWTHAQTAVALGIAGEIEDGRFSERLLPVGTYVLSCAPGAPGDEDRFRGPGSQVLAVPPEGLPDATWKVPTGGALRITFRSADGTMIEPGDMRSVRAKGDDDAELQIDLFHQRSDGQWREGTGETVPYETRTLAAGTYDVTWYDRGEGGNPLASVRVEIVAGSLTNVTFARDR